MWFSAVEVFARPCKLPESKNSASNNSLAKSGGCSSFSPIAGLKYGNIWKEYLRRKAVLEISNNVFGTRHRRYLAISQVGFETHCLA